VGPSVELAAWVRNRSPVLEVALLKREEGNAARQRTRDEETTVKNKK